jgi:hypothetical protein
VKAEDIVAEIRAEMGRRQITAASIARDLKVNDRALRRCLRGQQRFTDAELDAVLAHLGMTLTIERTEK